MTGCVVPCGQFSPPFGLVTVKVAVGGDPEPIIKEPSLVSLSELVVLVILIL